MAGQIVDNKALNIILWVCLIYGGLDIVSKAAAWESPKLLQQVVAARDNLERLLLGLGK